MPLNERHRTYLHTAGACLPLGQLDKLQEGSKGEYGGPICLNSRGAAEFQHIRVSPRCERRVKVPLNERQRTHLHTDCAFLPLGQLVKLQKRSKCEYGCPLCLYSRGSGPVFAYPGLPTV